MWTHYFLYAMAESFNGENACHPCCCQSSLRSLSDMISDYEEEKVFAMNSVKDPGFWLPTVTQKQRAWDLPLSQLARTQRTYRYLNWREHKISCVSMGVIICPLDPFENFQQWRLSDISPKMRGSACVRMWCVEEAKRIKTVEILDSAFCSENRNVYKLLVIKGPIHWTLVDFIMSTLPTNISFPKEEETIAAKWEKEDSFHTQNRLSKERGDEVR